MDSSLTPPLRSVDLEAIAIIGHHFGVSLTEIEVPDSGQGRTVFAKTESVDVVVKWSSEPDWVRSLERSVTYGEALRRRGYPTPPVIAYGLVAGVGAASVQLRLPGNPSLNGLSDELFREVVEVIELQADAHVDFEVPDLDGWTWVTAVVFDDAANWWSMARNRGEAENQLCDHLWSYVNGVERPSPRSDWVTHDFNFGNILNVDGRLSGVIDLDHLAFGDRSNDLLSLAFGFERLAWSQRASHNVERLADIRSRVLAISGEAGWRQGVVYRAISSLGWRNERGMHVPTDEAMFAIEGLLAVSRQ